MHKLGSVARKKQYSPEKSRSTENWESRVFVIDDDVANDSDWSFMLDRAAVVGNLRQKFVDLVGDTLMVKDKVVNYNPGQNTRSCVVYPEKDGEEKRSGIFDRPDGAVTYHAIDARCYSICALVLKNI